MYFSTTFHAKKGVLKYFSRVGFDLLPCIPVLKRYWKRRSAEMTEIEVSQEDEMIFTTLLPFLEGILCM